jgi:uncharacterized phage protein (TIGR02220 family)
LPAQGTKDRFALATPTLIRAGHGDDATPPRPSARRRECPLPTVTGSNEIGIATPFLVPNFGERPGQEPRTHGIDEPAPTIAATGHIQLARAVISPCTHHDESNRGDDQPADHHRRESRRTIARRSSACARTATRNRALVDEPLPDRHDAKGGEMTLATPAIAEGYYIDILYRMLHWSELARATSFEDEERTYHFTGTATEITKQIGNAVPIRTGRMKTDPDFFDAKVAGWWVWGASCWIGAGWCDGSRLFARDGGTSNKKPETRVRRGDTAAADKQTRSRSMEAAGDRERWPRRRRGATSRRSARGSPDGASAGVHAKLREQIPDLGGRLTARLAEAFMPRHFDKKIPRQTATPCWRSSRGDATALGLDADRRRPELSAGNGRGDTTASGDRDRSPGSIELERTAAPRARGVRRLDARVHACRDAWHRPHGRVSRPAVFARCRQDCRHLFRRRRPGGAPRARVGDRERRQPEMRIALCGYEGEHVMPKAGPASSGRRRAATRTSERAATATRTGCASGSGSARIASAPCRKGSSRELLPAPHRRLREGHGAPLDARGRVPIAECSTCITRPSGRCLVTSRRSTAWCAPEPTPRSSRSTSCSVNSGTRRRTAGAMRAPRCRDRQGAREVGEGARLGRKRWHGDRNANASAAQCERIAKAMLPIAKNQVTKNQKPKKIKDAVGLAPDAAHASGTNGHDELRTRELRVQAVQILEFLNEKAGKNYQPVKANVDLIVARLKEGGTVDDMRAIVAKKCREWRGREGMEEYLRPATLFGAKNFWQKYQGELAPAGTTQ